ncbi:Sepiapterin reductase [compost metagenome]
MAFSAAVAWGGLPDLVIHCAGVGEFGPVGVYTAEQVRRVVESNLISTILVAQQTVRLIGSKGGVLANVLSSAAQTGKANESLYCASKWGMRGFLESLRAELKGSPLRLVNLYPSGIRSEFWDGSSHVDSSNFMTPEDAAAYMLDALEARSSCHVTDLFIGRNE